MVPVVQQSSPSHIHQLSGSNVHSFNGGVKEANTSWGGVYVQWKQNYEKRTVQVYLSFMKSNTPFLTPDSFQVSPDFTGYV